ncbi:MAG: hypothetical protein AAFU71_07975 [Cyanobacteria bacterium J06632_22]
MKIPRLALAALLAVAPTIATAPTGHAQSADDLNATAVSASPLAGAYSNGFRYVHIAQRDDRVCVAAFFDREGQAAALDDALEQIRQEAAAAEAELEALLQQQVNEQRQQVIALLADEALLNRAIASDQISPEQAAQLERFRNDPSALDQFLEEQVRETRQRASAEIEQRRRLVESEIAETANTAANFQTFQGVISVARTAPLNIYATDTADIVLLPQENGLVLLGTPDRLVNYIPLDETVEDAPNLLERAEMQSCLTAEAPFRESL